MGAADVPWVATIEARAFTDPWSAASFAEFVGQPHVIALVAEDGGAAGVVGYAIGTVVADEGEVLNLAVDPAARRRGIGRNLVGALLERLEARGAESLYLEVRASNEAAIGLYRTAGFEPLGRRKAYYRAPREDAVTMVRRQGRRTAEK